MTTDSNAEVIRRLNDVLTGELTAINQYFLHAKMLQNWGLHRLAKLVRHESIDEMKHADAVIDRILYLEGLPNLQRYSKIKVGETPREQFIADLSVEDDAIPRLREAIAYCHTCGDHGTRVLLEKILVDEEEHRDWLKQQLDLIARLGETAYLAEQMKSD